ncbi:MFS general substrate transporter [Peniophora sp. CONT]|nr:MFS general substrate transporter [Peniophora sp. CONT]
MPAGESGVFELESLRRGGGESVNAIASMSSTVALESEHQREEEALALPPVDGGLQAWKFVLCAFILETLVWGFPLSYGVFQEWYLSSPNSPFRGASESAINAIGTITLGIQYMEGLGIIFFTQKWPQWTKTMMFAGLVVCVGALTLSSFATQVWHLIALQGVVYGIAGGVLYMPVVGWLSEWFVQRRSLAGGLIFGGTGLGGAGFPILANFLLQRVGFRWTLRTMAALVGVLGGLALLGAKPRLPVARHATPAPMSFSFVTSPVFIFMTITIFVQGLSYFPVSLYIPSYAASLGFSSLNGTLALAAFNLAAVVGQVLVGYYCDRGSYTTAMIVSSMLSAILGFVLWGFAHSLALIYVFAVLFGAISGGFSSTWLPAAAELFNTQSTPIFMAFSCAKGLAAITGPFIAAALHPKSVSDQHSAGSGGWAGYGFTAITIFVGSGMIATAGLSGTVLAFRKKIIKSE